MIVYTANKEKLVLANEPFSSGGEGEVRTIIRGTSNLKHVCVKIYYQAKRTKILEQKLGFMVKNPPKQVSGTGFMIGWPLALVYDKSGSFLGFAMPLAFNGSKQLVNLTSMTISKKLAHEWTVKYGRENGKAALINRMKLICNIAIPIHLLHATGKYVLRDFKPQNVLITLDGRVTIVDMDSVQITTGSSLLFAGTAATDIYMPPEFYSHGVGRNPAIPLKASWDHFAISVVFYQLLFGLHPYVVTPWKLIGDCNEIFLNIENNLFPFGPMANKIRSYPSVHEKFSFLPQPIKQLFLRSFGLNSYERPTAREWGEIIHKSIK